jgi:general stress protein 26
MLWSEFVAGASASSWLTYLGTADAAGHPHVSVVAPGFSDGVIWAATRRSSKKFRNLVENPAIAFHWPVASGGPGEMFARGTATLRVSADEVAGVWAAGVMPYDLTSFWKGPDDPELAFVETRVERASMIGPDFVTKVWAPGLA